MTTTIEDRYYMEDMATPGPVTNTCLRPITRLGYLVDCGMQLADDAEWDEVYCPYDLLAVDSGEADYAEYTAIREDRRERAA